MDRPVPTKQADINVAPAGRSVLVAGSLAGVAAGIAMAAYLVLAAVLQGMEPFTALEPMGATFRDAGALDGGSGSLPFGVLLHLFVSAIVGLIFAIFLPGDLSPAAAAVLCIGLAFTVMGFMTSLVVPAVNPLLEDRFHDFGGSWVIAHALFGITAALVCQRLRRRLAGRAAGRPLRRAA